MAEMDVNGTRLHYRIDGNTSAPVLVFSNSLGTRLEMWDAQYDALASQYAILRYDSRGHGQSAAPEGDYTIDQLGRDLLELLDGLGIKRFRYCGLSKGGMVGQWLGAEVGDRIDRLVLCNTSSHLGPKDLWNDRIAAVLEGGMGAIADGVVDRWFTPGFQTRDPSEVNRIKDMILSTPPQGYAGCCAAIRDMDLRGRLSEISAPTLVIAGDSDPATPVDHAEAIADGISGAELHVIADAAHLSNIEQSAAFTAVLSRFLE